mgnify:CR=1 FL=1
MYKLMIVDDSMIIRNKIARMVNGKYNVVGRAQNGFEAMSLCNQYMPDLVTLDLTMPKMGGLECIVNLVKIKPDIQILVVSALADKATGIKALELGANGFLTKPFTNNDLLESLHELMEDF